MTPWVHLFGNWKWTGPADLVLSQVAGVRQRASLLLGPCPHADLQHAVAAQASRREISHAFVPSLSKHWNPWRARRAARALRRHFQAEPPSVVHAHFDGDHFAGWRALPEDAVLVRTVHSPAPHPRRRLALLRSQTHLVAAPTRGLARDLEQALGWTRGDVATLAPAVDVRRFSFDEARRRRGRQRLGLPDDAFAIGIVARVQRHRRYELLIETWRRLASTPNPPHLVVLGRGTHFDELLVQPIRQHGLESLIHLPGYQEGAAYLDALAACDAGLFLVPGSDVTCRASREWMAMGRAVLSSARPPLPEFVLEGETGQVMAESADAWCAALSGTDRDARWRDLGARAANWCRTHWTPEGESLRLHQLYDTARLARPSTPRTEVGRRLALVMARPGWHAAAQAWATERGLKERDVLVCNPATSRDAVLDLLTLRTATHARHVLLEPSGDWDGPCLDELASRRQLDVTLLDNGTLRGARGRWLQTRLGAPWKPSEDVAPLPHTGAN